MSNRTSGNSVTRSGARTLGICIFLAVAGLLLWQEHRAHIAGLLPYLLIAACPIVHLLMHRGHGGHSHTDHPGQDSRRAS